MSLQGASQLRARLKALRLVFKPIARDWADEAVELIKESVPNRDTRWSKGRLHDSIRRKSATQRKAVVAGHYTGYFVDKGVVPHSLKKRKGRTIFSRLARKKHPGYPARPYRVRSATEALRRHPIKEKVIDVWNAAA